jgi:hypothetical protein
MAKLRSFTQLVSEGFLVPQSDEPTIFEQLNETIEIEYNGWRVCNFHMYKSKVYFCSQVREDYANLGILSQLESCESDRDNLLSYYDVLENDTVFNVFRVDRSQL